MAERQPVQVKFGVPFGVSPDLSGELKRFPDRIHVDTVELDIEGSIKGKVTFWKRLSFEEPTAFLRTPAGNLVVELTSVNGDLKVTENTAPVEIEVDVEGINRPLADSLYCNLVFDGISYPATQDYDDSEFEKRNSKGNAYFFNWLGPDNEEHSDERGDMFFPQDPDIFAGKRFQLILTPDPTRYMRQAIPVEMHSI